MFLKKNQLLVILGPTATGKTDLALNLAKKFNGELVSCDSRQVYKGLDIGTGKMPSSNGQLRIDNGQLKQRKGYWEIDGIKIWMYDVVSPKRQYNVARFVKDTEKVIDGIYKRDKLPILVGGTGLYIKAVTEGLSNLSIPVDWKLRQELEKLSLEQLQEKLQKLSPQRRGQMNNSDQHNARRLVRLIELASADFTLEESLRATVRGGFHTLKIGLTASRGILYQRTDARVVSRIKQGMIEEAKTLNKTGLTLNRMKQLGLEYGVLADYIDGNIRDVWGDQGLIKIMQGKIHGFVRRQLTWFKNPTTNPGSTNWFDITSLDYSDKIEKLVRSWYDSTKD